MSVQKYFKCKYNFICLFSLKVSLEKVNVDVPAEIITFLSVKLSMLNNAIMSITNKWVFLLFNTYSYNSSTFIEQDHV